MTEQEQDLAIAEARLLIATCVYVDAAEYGDDLGQRKAYWEGLRAAVADYRVALQGKPLPADHPLVVRGMEVVRRLLG